MDNPTLKKKSQVTLEFVLALIVILILFIGGFNLWSDLNKRFVTEATDYQAQRLSAGQGNITIPGQPVIPAVMPPLDDPTMNKILQIQQCACINDALKQQAAGLYTRQYELGIEIQAYQDIIAGLEEAKRGMQDAYNQIPWCSSCCLCTIRCICGYECAYGGGPCDEDCSSCVPIYCTYETTCGGSLSNQCVSCSGGNWYCSYSEDYTGNCISIRKNPNHNHTTYRQQIQDSIDQTQAEIDAQQATLDGYIAEKATVDSQIAVIEPQLACCGI